MSAVTNFYNGVISDVITGLKKTFHDEGMDESILSDLKEIWERKVRESGALDPPKPLNPPTAIHFSSVMQQNNGNDQKNLTRIATINNSATTRLIKPSSQNQIIADPNMPQQRLSVPTLLFQPNTFRPGVANHPFNRNMHMNYLPGSYYNSYSDHQSDFIFKNWLRHEVNRVPNEAKMNYSHSNPRVYLNQHAPQGMTVVSQYQSMLPQQSNSNQIIQDNSNAGINLRKTQNDGNLDSDEDSSDDDDNFINVPDRESMSMVGSVGPTPKSEPRKFSSAMPDFEDEDEEDDEALMKISPNDMLQRVLKERTTGADVKLSDTDKKIESDDSDDEDDEEEEQAEDDPLNTDDDISDDDPEKIFDCDNVVVCQYEKVGRARNKWKLNFISGIANLDGRDSVFHRALGEAEW